MRQLGRYAPSPTGAHHLGNLRAAVLAWADAQLAGGRCALRIDDLDGPRVRPGSEAAIREELAWLGLRFDPLPAGGRRPDEGAGASHPACRQQGRGVVYRAALEQLIEARAVYPCPLSGREFAACLSAPHRGEEGAQRLSVEERQVFWEAWRSGDAVSWRFAASAEPVSYVDEAFGPQSVVLDDFVVWRRDGMPSYQLATVVDDEALGVTRVVRGADLIPSTLRQVALLRAFRLGEPQYKHLNLVVTDGGERMAKRMRAAAVSTLREKGVSAQQLLGWVLASVTGEAVEPVGLDGLVRGLEGRDWGCADVVVDGAALGAGFGLS